ncbi:MAG: cupin domain-containing protein [Actinomycetota bacterium]
MSDTTIIDAATDTNGWAFGSADEMEWQQIGEHVSMKLLAIADGKGIGLFKFAPGYAGGVHQHLEAEFGFVLEGSVVANGVTLGAGQAYAAQPGTEHHESPCDGATLLSVFTLPG